MGMAGLQKTKPELSLDPTSGRCVTKRKASMCQLKNIHMDCTFLPSGQEYRSLKSPSPEACRDKRAADLLNKVTRHKSQGTTDPCRHEDKTWEHFATKEVKQERAHAIT